jgi:transcriptional regulator CtsR
MKRYGGYYQNGGGTGSQEEVMQQLLQGAYQAFQKGASPEQILQALVKQGVPEDTAMQMLKMVVDQTENGDEQSQYARGGGIHIKPSRRGTFTAQATRMGMGVQEAARHILANKDRYSSKMVRKANFARNASKWKHAYGGYAGMYQEGGEAMPQEMMEAPQQQMQEQAMGQEQQQGGQDQMMQQLMQMVAQALQQGVPPEQIVQMLVQQGVPQEVAVQAVQMVMQQMGGGAPQGGPGQQYQPQGGQYQGPQPMAAMGGYYANGGINNAGFRALPPSVQQKIMDNMAYGGYYEDGGFFNQSYMPFDY